MPSVYEIVQERILASLEKGVVPWNKPWRSLFPSNLVSKKPYKGINTFLLADHPWWVTEKQAKDLGGSRKAGERGSIAVFWKVSPREESEERRKNRFVLRYYSVFHEGQVEGVSFPMEREEERPAEMQGIFESYLKKSGVGFEESGNSASYLPSADKILIPRQSQFESVEHYYHTLFHEVIHSTAKRCGRELGMKGTLLYAKEELIAEIGAAFLMSKCGKEGCLDNSASYLAHWRERIAEDQGFLIVNAASKARQAVDYILGEEQGHDTE